MLSKVYNRLRRGPTEDDYMVILSSSPNRRHEFRNSPDRQRRRTIIQPTSNRKADLRQSPMIDGQWIEFLAIATLLYILVMLIR